MDLRHSVPGALRAIDHIANCPACAFFDTDACPMPDITTCPILLNDDTEPTSLALAKAVDRPSK